MRIMRDVRSVMGRRCKVVDVGKKSDIHHPLFVVGHVENVTDDEQVKTTLLRFP